MGAAASRLAADTGQVPPNYTSTIWVDVGKGDDERSVRLKEADGSSFSHFRSSPTGSGSAQAARSQGFLPVAESQPEVTLR